MKISTKPRRIALRSTDRPKPTPREKMVPLLCEVAADGFLTFFGPRHVRPIVVNRLVALGPEEAGLVEKFHELEIPRPYREFYCSRHILKTHLLERRTLERETRRRERLAILRIYQQLAEERKEGGSE